MKRKKLKGVEIYRIDTQQEAIYSDGLIIGTETRTIYWVCTQNEKQRKAFSKLGLKFEYYNEDLRGFVKTNSPQMIKVFCKSDKQKERFWNFILGIKQD